MIRNWIKKLVHEILNERHGYPNTSLAELDYPEMASSGKPNHHSSISKIWDEEGEVIYDSNRSHDQQKKFIKEYRAEKKEKAKRDKKASKRAEKSLKKIGIDV